MTGYIFFRNPKSIKKREAGFLLAEVALAVGILSILGTALYPRITLQYDLRRIEQTAEEVYYIQSAARNYRAVTGNWPADIATLQAAGYLPVGWSGNSIWGNPYSIVSVSGGARLDVSIEMPERYQHALKSYLPYVVVDTVSHITTAATPSPGTEAAVESLVPLDGSRSMTGNLRISKQNPGLDLADSVANLTYSLVNRGGLLALVNNAGTDSFTLNQTGEMTTTGDIKSPRLIDSDDNNYYLDPAGASRVSVLTASTLNLGDANTSLTKGADNSLQATFPSGNLLVNATTTQVQIDTDRTDIGFQKGIIVNSGYMGALGNTGGKPIADNSIGGAMYWHPSKYAFRSGYVNGTNWSDANTGSYSVAMGYNNKAAGSGSTAFGQNQDLTGAYSFSAGGSNTITATYGSALGWGNIVAGQSAFAAGESVTAAGAASIALGKNLAANLSNSIVIGSGTLGLNLINNLASSIMMGSGSTTPAIHAYGGGSATRVRIGNSTSADQGSMFVVDGAIESISGGFKFPDGTVQTTAAVAPPIFWNRTSASILIPANPGDHIATTGRIGAGKLNPAYPVDVYSATTATSGTIIGANTLVAHNPSSASTATVYNQYNEITTSYQNQGSLVNIQNKQTSAQGPTITAQYGIYNNIERSVGTTTDMYGVFNYIYNANSGGTGGAKNMYGVYNSVSSSNGVDGTTQTITGTLNSVLGTGNHNLVIGSSNSTTFMPSGAATLAAAYGVKSVVVNNGSVGNITDAYGFNSSITNIAFSGGVISNAYAYSANITKTFGSITNAYGLYVSDLSAQATNAWGIYTAGNTSSYFGGNIGIGVTTPGASLDISRIPATSGGISNQVKLSGILTSTAATDQLTALRIQNTFAGTAGAGLNAIYSNQGNLIMAGTYSGALGALATTGAGTRLMWLPEKAALRAGEVASGEWDSANIGNHSVAIGKYNTASGIYSVSLGGSNTASGPGSVAIGGWLNQAAGFFSTVSGWGNTINAAGWYSVAIGGTKNIINSANCSTLGGAYLKVDKPYSYALGKGIGVGQELTNNISNSFMLGWNSTTPAFHITGGGGTTAIAIGKILPVTSPNVAFDVDQSTTAASGIAIGSQWTNTLTASANNDDLVGMYINPTFVDGIFTGVKNTALRVSGVIESTSGGIKFPDGTMQTTAPEPSYWSRTGTVVSLATAGDTVNMGDVTTGNLVVNGTFSNPSDKRLKHSIINMQNPLEKILALRGVNYYYRNDIPGRKLPGGMQYGFIAQELERVFPELVTTATDGYKQINPIGLIAPIIESVRDINARLARLEKTISVNLDTSGEINSISFGRHDSPFITVHTERIPDKKVSGYLSTRDVYLADQGKWASETAPKLLDPITLINGPGHRDERTYYIGKIVPKGTDLAIIELNGTFCDAVTRNGHSIYHLGCGQGLVPIKEDGTLNISFKTEDQIIMKIIGYYH